MDFDNCKTEETHKVIVRREKKSEVRIDNKHKKTIEIVTVDGCLLATHEPKCDYLFKVPSEKVAIFVELKGCDLDKAIAQLLNTIERTKPHLQDFSKSAYISSSNIPSFRTTFQRKQKQFKRSCGVTVSMKKSPLEISA